jgi:1,4-dihydroxy-2-naphthoate octaprenyltransferase
MKAFQLKISTLLLRFYLMMAIVVIAGFTGQWWLAVLSLPVFISAILGIQFGKNDKKEVPIKRLPAIPRLEKKAI